MKRTSRYALNQALDLDPNPCKLIRLTQSSLSAQENLQRPAPISSSLPISKRTKESLPQIPAPWLSLEPTDESLPAPCFSLDPTDESLILADETQITAAANSTPQKSQQITIQESPELFSDEENPSPPPSPTIMRTSRAPPVQSLMQSPSQSTESYSPPPSPSIMQESLRFQSRMQSPSYSELTQAQDPNTSYTSYRGEDKAELVAELVNPQVSGLWVFSRDGDALSDHEDNAIFLLPTQDSPPTSESKKVKKVSWYEPWKAVDINRPSASYCLPVSSSSLLKKPMLKKKPFRL